MIVDVADDDTEAHSKSDILESINVDLDLQHDLAPRISWMPENG